MFIGSLYLIAVLATQCLEVTIEVGDYYIIEELQNPLADTMSSISEIAYLLPPENEAETLAYPYVKTVKSSVLIARTHFRKDFKSSKKISFNFFHKNIDRIGGFLGENPPFVCI